VSAYAIANSLQSNQPSCLCVFMIVIRPGHDVKLHSHFHCHWLLFVLMCHEASQSAFLHTQLYLSMNLDKILFSNVS